MPVIIITGQRQDEIDRVVGLELGADDYLTKPFDLRELLARVRAILRRSAAAAAVGEAAAPSPAPAQAAPSVEPGRTVRFLVTLTF